jgi:SnoaL-like domain
MESLDTRLQYLEDIEAIKHLKARAGRLADQKYTPDHHKRPQEEVDEIAWQQARLFAPDGEVMLGPGKFARGHQALFENFRHRPWRFALHMYYCPIIDHHGDRASGQWVFWCLATDETTNAPLHVAGYIQDEYVKLDGNWLFQSTRLNARLSTGFGEPWTNDAGAIL